MKNFKFLFVLPILLILAIGCDNGQDELSDIKPQVDLEQGCSGPTMLTLQQMAQYWTVIEQPGTCIRPGEVQQIKIKFDYPQGQFPCGVDWSGNYNMYIIGYEYNGIVNYDYMDIRNIFFWNYDFWDRAQAGQSSISNYHTSWMYPNYMLRPQGTWLYDGKVITLQYKVNGPVSGSFTGRFHVAFIDHTAPQLRYIRTASPNKTVSMGC